MPARCAATSASLWGGETEAELRPPNSDNLQIKQRGERNPFVFREGEQVCTEANPTCVCDPSLSWWRLPEECGALGPMPLQVLIWAVLGAVRASGHRGMVDDRGPRMAGAGGSLDPAEFKAHL